MVARNEVMGDRQALFSEWMGSALDCAVDAASRGDIPIGALVANADGRVVAMAGNRREIDGDPTAHAEILALRSAAQETVTGAWTGARWSSPWSRARCVRGPPCSRASPRW